MGWSWSPLWLLMQWNCQLIVHDVNVSLSWQCPSAGRARGFAAGVGLHFQQNRCFRGVSSSPPKRPAWFGTVSHNVSAADWFNIMIPTYQYSKSHCGDKMSDDLMTIRYPQWDFLYWQDDIFILNQGPGPGTCAPGHQQPPYRQTPNYALKGFLLLMS